jgi:ribosomal protein S14
MGLFGSRSPEEETRRLAKKHRWTAPAPYRATKAERRRMLKAAAGRKLADSSGRIVNVAAMKTVGTFAKRINRQECPKCGRPQPRKNTMCRDCVRDLPDEREIRKWQDAMSLYDEQGRNKNGLRYDENGKRIWD